MSKPTSIKSEHGRAFLPESWVTPEMVEAGAWEIASSRMECSAGQLARDVFLAMLQAGLRLAGEGYEIKTYPSLDALQIHLHGPRIAEFKRALDRALNTWPEAPAWLWQLDEALK